MLRAVLIGRLTGSGFILAWFSSLSSERLCYLQPSFCLLQPAGLLAIDLVD